jgi:hypothetical protein
VNVLSVAAFDLDGPWVVTIQQSIRDMSSGSARRVVTFDFRLSKVSLYCTVSCV